jgi:hypothetical protein
MESRGGIESKEWGQVKERERREERGRRWGVETLMRLVD